jgi:phosphate transport system substrate-binding protein
MTAVPRLPPSPAGSEPPAPPTVRRKADRGPWYAILAIGVVAVVVVTAGATSHWYGLVPSSNHASAACPTGVTLSGAGASFLSALMEQWEISYNTATANRINYDASGAGQGITSLSEKQVDFAATDEPVTPAEVASLPGTTLTLPVTGGAVAIVYDLPGYPHTVELNASELIGIYSGTIANWDSPLLNETGLNPGLPDQPVVPVVRSDAAGTTYVLTNYLSDDNSTWASTVGTSIQPTWPKVSAERPEKGNSGLATFVNETSGAVGYVDLADAESHTHLGVAAVENPQGQFIVPTVANVQSAIDDLAGQPIPSATGNWSAVSWVNAPGSGDYPLSTLSYLLVLQDPAIGYEPSLANATVLVQWLDWVVADGPGYSSALLYDNPPAALLTQDRAAISNMTFNGASIPVCS